MAKFEELPEDPNNSDLASGIKQLHDCFEEHKRDQARFNAKQTTANIVFSSQLKSATGQIKIVSDQVTEVARKAEEVSDKVDEIAANSSNVVKSQSVIQSAFGLEDQAKKPRKPIAFMKEKDLLFKVGSTVMLALGLWKFIGFSAPYIWSSVKGFWQFLLALNMFIIHH